MRVALGLGLPTPAQQAALASAGDGPGGWAKIVATGAERSALQETFREAATSTEPTPPTGVATLDTGALLDEARKATRRHDYATAIATLDRLLAVDPSHARAWSSRGYAWDALEVADLLACVPGPHSEQVHFARTLIDLLSWMATARLLEPDTVAGYLDEIEEYGPRDARVRAALTDARRRVGR